MTNQEIFDKVSVALLRQGKKSHDPRQTCLYRSRDALGNVLKCGVGHLIPDRAYDSSYEYKSFTVLIGEHPELLKIIGISRGQLGLVTALQLVHDDAYPSQWKERLVRIAQGYALDSFLLNGFN